MNIKEINLTLEEVIGGILSRNGISHVLLTPYTHKEFAYLPDEVSLNLEDAILIPLAYLSPGLFDSIKMHYMPLSRDIAFTSKNERTKGKHIPQVDFKCNKTNHGIYDVAVYSMIDLSIDSGYILDSGNSYHVYGRNFIDDRCFKELMEKIKSNGGRLADQKWADYQLRRGFSMLRIVDSKNKPTKPMVMGEFSK